MTSRWGRWQRAFGVGGWIKSWEQEGYKQRWWNEGLGYSMRRGNRT